MVETSLVSEHVAVLRRVEFHLNTMAKLQLMEAYFSQGSLLSRVPLFCSPTSIKRKKKRKELEKEKGFKDGRARANGLGEHTMRLGICIQERFSSHDKHLNRQFWSLRWLEKSLDGELMGINCMKKALDRGNVELKFSENCVHLVPR